MPTRVTIQQIYNSPLDDTAQATKDAQDGTLKPVSVTVTAQVQAAPRNTTMAQSSAPSPTPA